MSETDKALAEAIKRASEASGEAKAFFAEQAPMVADEILTYAAIKHSVFIVICMLIAIAAALVVKRCFKDTSGMNDGLGDAGEIGMLYVAFVGIPALVGVLWQTSLLVKVWVAPKLYLLEYVKDLI